MIFKFKLFESSESRDLSNLVDTLDDDYIDQYFRDHYSLDEDSISYYVDVFKYVDDDQYVKDFIDDFVNGADIQDFDEEDYVPYIESDLLDKKDVTKYLDKKGKKLGITDYEEILKTLTKKQLIRLIENENKEEEFIRAHYEGIYGDSDAYDLLSEIYGRDDIQENAYKYLQNYVDYDEMVENFYKNSEDSFKQDIVKEEIYRDKKLQKKLLKVDSENAIPLFNIMQDTKKSIGGTFKFQEKYMQEIMKEEDMEDLYVAKKLKELNDKFGLAHGMEEKYKDYTFYIDTEKFNL